MSSSNLKILVGDISSYKAIAICKYIRYQYPGIKIYTFDYRKFTKFFRTKYSDKHFYLKKENFDTKIQKIIKNYKINYFFPVINKEISTFWSRKDLYEDSLSYLGDYKSYEVMNDKLLLSKLAIKLNINIPLLYDNIKDSKVPFVIKPTNLSSAKGVKYITKRKNIPNILSYDNIIIQDFICGIGVGYSFYSKNGKIIQGYGHKRLCEYPISGGSSTYRSQYYDKRMHDIASKIVGYLNYTGFAMFEYKLTDKNDIYLIEVNPRIWGSINQGLVNGVNYFEKIIGKGLHRNKKNKSFNTYISPLVYFSFFNYVLNFNYKSFLIFLWNFKKNISDVSFIKDIKGYTSMILRKIL